jgi:hypothetical protein
VSSHGQPHAARPSGAAHHPNRQDGNPFATDEVIADLIDALGTAYLAAPNARVSRAIKVELDLLETLM